jgi:hypothetical protein
VDPGLHEAGPARRPFGFEKFVRSVSGGRSQMKEAISRKTFSHLSFAQEMVHFRSLISFS